MSADFNDGKWLNEPMNWNVGDIGLTLTTDEKTDFWRETYYGFTRDSGHFLGFPTADRFTAAIRIKGEFRRLYDQAGLMGRSLFGWLRSASIRLRWTMPCGIV